MTTMKTKIKEAMKEIAGIFIPAGLIVTAFFAVINLGSWFIPHKEVHDEVVYLFDKGDAMVLWLSPLHHEKEITIPAEIQGRKVTQIRSKAFKKAYWVEHISIPDKVQFVEEDMFWNSIDVTIYSEQ